MGFRKGVSDRRSRVACCEHSEGPGSQLLGIRPPRTTFPRSLRAQDLSGQGEIACGKRLEASGSEPQRMFRLLFPMSLWAQTYLRFWVPFRCLRDFWTLRGELVASEEVISAG